MVHEQKAKEQSNAPQVSRKIVFYISRRVFTTTLRKEDSMRITDQISAESASKVYRKVNGELAEVAGVRAVHTSVPSQDFESIKHILDNRVRHSQELIRMWAESMKKAGLRTRFPRFE